MTARRPLTIQSGLVREIVDTDGLLFGMEQCLSKTVVTTNGLATIALSVRRTFMTGNAAATLVITLPAANAAIDGQLMTIVSTVARSLVSWTSSGGVVTGLPTSLTANTEVTVIYHHALTRWFRT